MSHPRRTLAQLRAGKEARLRTVQEGIRLRDEVGQILVDHQKPCKADYCLRTTRRAPTEGHAGLCPVGAWHLSRPSKCLPAQGKCARRSGTN